MKRVKRTVSSCSEYGNEPPVPGEDVIPVRVLRSHKRRLLEAQLCERRENVKSQTVATTASNDCSDCVVVEEINAPVAKPLLEEKGVATSTPLKRGRSKKPKFDESCIRPGDSTYQPLHSIPDAPKNASNEVIVLSDSATSTSQVIVLSDDEKDQSDTEIEILPSVDNKEKDVKTSPTKILQQISKRRSLRRSIVTRKSPLPSGTIALAKKFSHHKRKKFWKHYSHHRKNRYPPLKPICQENKTGTEQIGENVYFDGPLVLPKVGLRPIIIDGSNVAFYHSNNSYFSCKGLEICIKYFKKRGHQVIAFVPHFRVQNDKSDNPRLLEQLVRHGDVVLTPSRMVDGNPIVPYDDRFIVQTAVLKGGIIVSRDNYRDLLAENPAWSETIKYRVLQFTWVQDLLIFPKDPLGERGPSLEEFLRFG